MIAREVLLSAAQRLHAHLLRRHYSGGLLHGPDAGVRFNLRAWRFIKSAMSFVPWQDDYVFMQSQGYWVLSSWMLFETTGIDRFREVALEATEATLRLQRPDGYWDYPLPERRHLIAALETIWGSIALLATHEREPRAEFLSGATRAYDFLLARVGFQDHSRGKAINYFDRPRGKVPNNSVAAIWFFLRLWKATGDTRYLQHVEELGDFLSAAQLPSGELPYIVEGPHEQRREHYLCFQYNAFQFLQLAWSVALKPQQQLESVLPQIARFLQSGVTSKGASAADCFHTTPEVDYYTAVLAAALHEAAGVGLRDAAVLSERCYAHCLAHQKSDRSFGYSTGDYGFLRDTRSYPRPRVMTLFHLLYPICGDGFSKTVES